MVHLQVEQSCLLMHFYDDSRDVIQFECKHFFHPFNTISLYICRLTAAGSVIPYTTIFNDPVTRDKYVMPPQLLSKKGKGFDFDSSDSHDKASSGSDYRQDRWYEPLSPWTCQE